MKRLLTVLILAGAGYFGYNYYIGNKADIDQRINALLKHEDAASTTASTATPTAPGAPGTAGPGSPGFESRIDAPPAPTGEKQYAPPGVFYMTNRVSVMTANGVKAVNPGEKVKLLQRVGSGRMKVTLGDPNSDFEVKESDVTNDLDLAREAEKRDFVSRGGKL